MALITYPNVPDLPGVPAIARSLDQPFVGQSDVVIDDLIQSQPTDITAPNVDFGQQWGILDNNGEFAITPDSMLAVEVKSDRDISDYPVEQGGFASYNKIAVPLEIRVTMTCGGVLYMDRAAFVSALESIRDSLDMYSVITVDRTYFNMNMTHFNYRRDASSGVSLLTVEAWFKEVRVTAVASYTQAAQPQGQRQVNQGPTNPIDPTQSQIKQVEDFPYASYSAFT